jgi:hypothetical protein
MARFKDFDAAASERKGEPITFRLGGRDWTAAHVNAANFLAFSRVIADAGGPGQATGFYEYIVATLADDDRDDFRSMLSEQDVQLATLIELMQWIIEQATGNPTSAASSSPAQPSKSGQPLRVFSLDPVSTPEVPASVTG